MHILYYNLNINITVHLSTAMEYTVQHTKCYGNETGYTLLI